MSTLFRLAALVLFILAALAGFGVIDQWTARTILGLLGAGGACAVAAGFTLPTIPTSGG